MSSVFTTFHSQKFCHSIARLPSRIEAISIFVPIVNVRMNNYGSVFETRIRKRTGIRRWLWCTSLASSPQPNHVFLHSRTSREYGLNVVVNAQVDSQVTLDFLVKIIKRRFYCIFREGTGRKSNQLLDCIPN